MITIIDTVNDALFAKKENLKKSKQLEYDILDKLVSQRQATKSLESNINKLEQDLKNLYESMNTTNSCSNLGSSLFVSGNKNQQ